MLDWLRGILITEEGKLLYFFMVIVLLMIIDCTSGFVGAIITKTVESKKITVGVLKKGFTIVMLAMLIPISLLLPSGLGISILFLTYTLTMVGEFTSILENFKKMGIEVKYFQGFIDKFIEKD